MAEVLEVPGCRVGMAAEFDGGMVLFVERRRRGERCPACGRLSRAGHGRYRRRPADLPSRVAARTAGPGSARAAVRERGLPAPDLCRTGSTACEPARTPDTPPVGGAEADRVRHERRGGGASGGCVGDVGEHLHHAEADAWRSRAASGNAPCDRHRRLGVAEGPELWHPCRRPRLERRRPLDLLPDRSGPPSPRGCAVILGSQSRPGTAPRQSRAGRDDRCAGVTCAS